MKGLQPTSRLIAMLMAWLLTSCAMTPNSNVIFLAEGLSLTLTAPPPGKISTLDSHLVAISSKNNSHQFIAQVEYRAGEIAMAAVSPQGLPLFDFIWFSDKTSEINQYVPLPSIDIGFIIADIQLCNWSLDLIKLALGGANISVFEQTGLPDSEIIWQRTIMQHNKIIIKIDKRTDGYELENRARGYRIRLTDLERKNS